MRLFDKSENSLSWPKQSVEVAFVFNDAKHSMQGFSDRRIAQHFFF